MLDGNTSDVTYDMGESISLYGSYTDTRSGLIYIKGLANIRISALGTRPNMFNSLILTPDHMYLMLDHQPSHPHGQDSGCSPLVCRHGCTTLARRSNRDLSLRTRTLLCPC